MALLTRDALGGTPRRVRSLLLVALLALLVVPVTGAAMPAETGDPVSLDITGSPFSPNGDGINDALLVDVTAIEDATLTLEIRDYDFKLIRALATGATLGAGTARWSWNGRDQNGRPVADGPYRAIAKVTFPDRRTTVSRFVAKAPDVPYGTAPGEIVVMLNAGHGDPDPGAVYSGIRESAMNLDIARRLRAMLEASGVRVEMSRTTDRAVNVPEVDVTGNGKVTHGDELVARNDQANLARADVFVTLMNNAYGCHCAQGTETYTSERRSWTPEAVQLGRYVQAAHIGRLTPFKTRRWRPNDRGLRFHDFFSTRPFDAKAMPRPALMPSILVESMFMDQPPELATLARRAVRTALAAAYFDGITTFLATRDFGLRYELLEVPTTALAGTPARARVSLTNRGNTTSAGWTLQARVVPAVPAVPYYYAKPARGTLIRSLPLPDGLAPGASIEVALDDLPLPPVGGEWIVLLDVKLPTGRTLGDHGVVGAQWRMTLTGPDVSPSPSVVPSADASPVPSVSTDPGASPSPSPSPSPPSPPPAPAEPRPEPPNPSPSPSPSPPPTPAPNAARGALRAPGRPDGGRVVPTPAPDDGGERAVRMRAWRRTLPDDRLRDVPSVAAAAAWPSRAAFRRWVVPIDIPIESRAGMAGVYGEDHSH